MPNITDVAREAGVSIATVSRVVNDNGYPVRAETRAQVEEAVKRLGFRPNDLARGLMQKRTRTVGLLVPDLANRRRAATSASAAAGSARIRRRRTTRRSITGGSCS